MEKSQSSTKGRGGRRKGAGPKPKPPQEKGVLLKAYPPRWLYELVRAEAKQTGKSLSEIVVEALKTRQSARLRPEGGRDE